ncbi:MAG: hypothetical protein LBP87_03250 [Planctomycetaceae bacterium]|jgi:hypothetical protein|nr:hypothetical protein [Planctomycetaceae bacterium]
MRPLTLDEFGTKRLLPATAPLTIAEPENDSDAVNLETLQELINQHNDTENTDE